MEQKKKQEISDSIKSTWHVFIIAGAFWVVLLITNFFYNYNLPLYVIYFSIIIWFSVGIILKMGIKFIKRGLYSMKYVLLFCGIISIVWSPTYIVMNGNIYVDPQIIFIIALLYVAPIWGYSIQLLRAAFAIKKEKKQILSYGVTYYN